MRLWRMKRKYRTADFAEKCSLLRKYYDCPTIMTDVIAGFRGDGRGIFESAAFVGIFTFQGYMSLNTRSAGHKGGGDAGSGAGKCKKLRSGMSFWESAPKRAKPMLPLSSDGIFRSFLKTGCQNRHKCATKVASVLRTESMKMK